MTTLRNASHSDTLLSGPLVFGTKHVLWTYSPAGSPMLPLPGTPTEQSHPHPPPHPEEGGQVVSYCESRQIRPELGALERGAHSQALTPHICTASRGF